MPNPGPFQTAAPSVVSPASGGELKEGSRLSPNVAREPWIIRTYAGFGDARQANVRFLRNLKEGQRGLWAGTHNSYTEISSETGVIGLFLFTAILVLCVRNCNAVYKRALRNPRWKQISNMAFCLLAALVGFSVNIAFCHIAYSYYAPALAGLTVAFCAAAQKEMDQSRAASAAKA